MRPRPPADPEKQARLQAELRRDRAKREQGYRANALRLLPHVCARCGRTFDGQRLRELTVHHKDHDYKHNPPDGSNWELLCLYCHDHEHEKEIMASQYGISDDDKSLPSTFSPFDALDKLLKRDEDKPESKPDGGS